MSPEDMQEETRTWSEEMSVAGNELRSTLERLAKDVTIHHIVVKSPNGDKLFELPAIAGAVAALFLGHTPLLRLAPSLIAQIKIEIVRREQTPESLDEEIEISVAEIDATRAEPEVEPPPTATNESSTEAAEATKEEVFVEEISVAKETEAPVEDASVNAEPDDLRKINGIGPKYAEALANNGFATYADLAKAKPKAITAALEAAGITRKVNCSSWPKQAKLASKGKWNKLAEFQAELKAK